VFVMPEFPKPVFNWPVFMKPVYVDLHPTGSRNPVFERICGSRKPVSRKPPFPMPVFRTPSVPEADVWRIGGVPEAKVVEFPWGG